MIIRIHILLHRETQYVQIPNYENWSVGKRVIIQKNYSPFVSALCVFVCVYVCVSSYVCVFVCVFGGGSSLLCDPLHWRIETVAHRLFSVELSSLTQHIYASGLVGGKIRVFAANGANPPTLVAY